MKTYLNKVAIVTGGASGIGEALCVGLAHSGARVVVTDVDDRKLNQVVKRIQESGGIAQGLHLDVTDPDAFAAVTAQVIRAEGRLDYLFNNAGIGIGGEVFDMKRAHWNRIIDVNIHGVINGISASYPHMVEQRGGHIVNIASLAGLLPAPGATAYCMTKHAVLGLSTALRGEAKAHGVKVTAVCPGFIQTQIYANSTTVNWDKEKFMNQPQLKRLMPASKCGQKILRGVAKNRSIVTVTGHAWWGWRLYRLMPGLFNSWLGPLGMKMARKDLAIKDSGDKPA